jgi:hypothetical protein
MTNLGESLQTQISQMDKQVIKLFRIQFRFIFYYRHQLNTLLLFVMIVMMINQCNKFKLN